MSKVIGVDIGGTKIKAGLVLKGKIAKRTEIKTEAKKGQKAVIKNIIEAISSVYSKDVKAVCIGCPGPLDIKKGIITYTPNLPFKNTNLKKILKPEFKKPVLIDNDANCFTLGEAVFGAAKKSKNVIGLTLGTDLGGGIVIDKKIYHGRGNAGEVGHQTINFKGPDKCSKCANHCLEGYVSARGVVAEAKKIGIKVSNPLELHKLALKGNKKAIKAWQAFGFYLGIGITNIIDCFDPDIIVMGGKVSNAWRFFNKEMNKTIRQRTLFKPCKVVRAKLGGNAGILGAAALT